MGKAGAGRGAENLREGDRGEEEEVALRAVGEGPGVHNGPQRQRRRRGLARL